MHNHWKTLILATATLASLTMTRPATAGVTLYGITGDGSPTPTTLFTINTATGESTPVLPLDNPGDRPDGEGIAFCPKDGLLYRVSGLRAGSQVFQAIDPRTLTVGPNLVPSASYGDDDTLKLFGEVHGIAWYEPLDGFLVTTIARHLYHVTRDGKFTEIGRVEDESGNAEWLRGLAVVGTRVFGAGPRFVPGINQMIWEIDPATGKIIGERDLVVDGHATWATGLTTHPVTGVVYGMVIDPNHSRGPRWLATIDVATGLGTTIGNTGEKFAGITFVVDPVTFESTAQDIADALAADLIDNSGIAQSLLAKLAAAAEAVDRGQPATAIENLDAFGLEVEAQTGRHLSPETADLLLDDAASLVESLLDED